MKHKLPKDIVIGKNVVIYTPILLGNGIIINDNAIIGRQPSLVSSPWTEVKGIDEVLIIEDDVIIGTGAIVYAGCHLQANCFIADLVAMREGCKIGKKTTIGRCVTLEINATIGDRCIISTGAHVTGGAIIGNDVLLAPNACLINAERKQWDRLSWVGDGIDRFGPYHKLNPPIIEDGVAIGTNATILGGIHIGKLAIVGAGAVVTKDIPAGETWVGNPARKLK